MFSEKNDIVVVNIDNIRQSEYVLQTTIHRVATSTDGNLILGGTFVDAAGKMSYLQNVSRVPIVPYYDKNMTFSVSVPNLIGTNQILYQFYLQGYEDDWGEWTKYSQQVYPNIQEGRYTLLARAKNDLGQISEPASFTFVILPPWYRTVWAYLAYLLLGVALVVSGRKYMNMRRDHRLAAEQAKELERERTVNKALQEANTSLQKANKLKDEFLATTSHELRTPLTAILGFTSVLKEEVPKDAEYREFLDIIEDSGGRLMDTLSSLLDLAQLRSGNYEINLEPLVASDVVGDAVATMRDLAARKGLRFVVEEPAERIRVTADHHMFTRVVYNLVNNAVKFTEEGEVRIRIQTEGECARIDVMDTGVGIEQQFLPELFEEYMQESDGNARSHEGSGLGLAISSQMMQLMNGTISVDSAKNMGSTFSIWFPLADAAPATENAHWREDRPATARANARPQQHESESYRAG